MSFSYGSVPPPDSPPLRAMPLSPAPARTDRRAKRQTTALSPSSIATGLSGLSLDDDPLDLNASGSTGRRSDSSLSRNSSIATTASSSLKRSSAAPGLPVPKMINSLPPNYQHPPSPAPSSAPSLSHSSSTHDSSSSCSSSIKSCSRAPKLNTAVLATNGASSSDSLSSEPVTPTGTSFSRSRGKSISRAVGKLASDFLNLKGGKKDRSEHPEPVPALPSGTFRK